MDEIDRIDGMGSMWWWWMGLADQRNSRKMAWHQQSIAPAKQKGDDGGATFNNQLRVHQPNGGDSSRRGSRADRAGQIANRDRRWRCGDEMHHDFR